MQTVHYRFLLTKIITYRQIGVTLQNHILWKYVLRFLNFCWQIRRKFGPHFCNFSSRMEKEDVSIHEGIGICRMTCSWDPQTLFTYRTHLGRLSWYEIAICMISDRMLWSSEATLREGTDSNDWKRQKFWKRNNWNEDEEKR